MALPTHLFAATGAKRLDSQLLDEAASFLHQAIHGGQVASAVMHVTQGETTYTRVFGGAGSDDAMFLLGSITKPICVTALMTLFDRNEFALADPVKKYLPEFTGDGRDDVTLQHLLTHVSGLPDQLPENNALRKQHASLAEFADHAARTPLNFMPGTRYQYSSMAILLALEVARRISGEGILEFVDRTVFRPLELKHAVLGLGNFKLEDMVPVQTEHAAPEAGAGDPTAKDWDWNSPYWRQLGAPWGGAHVSAPDLARFLEEFLLEKGAVVQPATARLMVSNRNPDGITPRGLGFGVGAATGGDGCSESTFGHTGSTGTLCWADPATQTICVVLTSLPARAVDPHPRDLAGHCVARATR